jgi:RNA polymerase sigma-70 factor (ECF subfamily)
METITDLWQTHRTRLRAYLARRIDDREAVDDLLQEVFLKAHQHLDGVNSSGSIAAWLFRIAGNALADYYRSRRPWEDLPEDLAAPEPAHDARAELADCLRPLIDGLPETDRLALVLSELEGLPQQAVADRLGLSLSGAKSRIQRGREKLRQRLLACCEIETGRRGIVDYAPRRPDGNGCCE